MQVILMEKLANLGDLGEVVKVKDGYARNYLIPHGKAKRATEANIKAFEAQARLIAAAALDSALRVEGFLCAKSARSKKLVLHITNVGFGQGD